MSDAIKHECGIALLQLKKPLSFFKEKYGSALTLQLKHGLGTLCLLLSKIYVFAFNICVSTTLFDHLIQFKLNRQYAYFAKICIQN